MCTYVYSCELTIGMNVYVYVYVYKKIVIGPTSESKYSKMNRSEK